MQHLLFPREKIINVSEQMYKPPKNKTYLVLKQTLFTLITDFK